MENKYKSVGVKIVSFFRGYKGKYFDDLYYRYRYFNLKGIASQGAYNLEQPEIYVDVDLASTKPGELIAGVVPQTDKTNSENSRRIWEYLDKRATIGNKIVIVGSPGSGKTTLLKQIALAFCRFPTKYNLPSKIPLILFLRNHTPEIVRNPDINLTAVLRDSLSRGEISFKESWFERNLRQGNCVILLDGLDEIGDSEYRGKVIKWVERQFANYPKNHFIVTSRPHGISNATISGAEILQILPLTVHQIETFIQDWYLATERRLSQSDDAGVRMIAREGAQDLLNRIQNTESLHPLARNALLLTMIATLHRFDAQLPGRRVELYDAIFKIFFRRREALGINPLTSEQSKSVLVPLASYMMETFQREISLEEAIRVIQKDLAEIGGEHIKPIEFLRGIQDQSGLLLEVAENRFSFASLTFQEYLASVYYAEKQGGKKLVGEIQNDWWWETIRLFCAQSDGTRIIEACLADEPIQLDQLQLAISCLEEALKVEVGVRARLNDIIRQGVDDPNPMWRNIIASALLFKRLRFMERIDARSLIDNSLVTNVEYQIFLDQAIEKGSCYIPDHWLNDRFLEGKALDPVAGVRISDVEKFCDWLVPQDIWRYHYRIPEERETTVYKCDVDSLQYWMSAVEGIRTNEAKHDVSPYYKEIIIQQMLDDSELLSSVRSALERAKNVKTMNELLAKTLPMEGRTLHSSFDLTAEIRAIELQKGEIERLKEWYITQKLQGLVEQLNLDFNLLLDETNIVNITNKDQVDWMAVFPQPPWYGFDLGKVILEFGQQYPSAQLRSMFGRKLDVVVGAHELASKMFLDRSWRNLVHDQNDRVETYNLIRLIARLSLLTMGIAGKMKYPSFSRDIGNIYLVYCLLERRVAGKEMPVEGIRLVKFS